jgi:hypothetical protein
MSNVRTLRNEFHARPFIYNILHLFIGDTSIVYVNRRRSRLWFFGIVLFCDNQRMHLRFMVH